MTVTTRIAWTSDLPCLGTLDRHLAGDALAELVAAGRVLVAEMDGVVVGCLRWGLFWDEVPFMNLLWVLPDRRGQGAGRALVDAWERSQAAAQHTFVLTSTVSAEAAQHFFRRLGYVDSGALLLPGEPAELLLRKDLQQFTSRTFVGRSHRANDHS
jgi:N-acetylglutamate synthase-like GNAT family acetyltransferase